MSEILAVYPFLCHLVLNLTLFILVEERLYLYILIRCRYFGLSFLLFRQGFLNLVHETEAINRLNIFWYVVSTCVCFKLYQPH